MRYDDSAGEEREVAAAAAWAGMRLDRALCAWLPEQSRSFLQRLIDDGLVEVNGRAAKASYSVRAGDKLSVFLPEPIAMSAEPEAIPLVALYEDADIVVVDKPPGLVAHPSPGHERGTLVNALLHHCGDLSGIGGVLRPGLVHRLDRDTSGCLVAAKHDEAHRRLMLQFMTRTVEKVYLALVDGEPRPPAGRVEGRIGRHPIDRQKHAMLKNGGRDSRTDYRVLEHFGAAALVECTLHTGRTHQIRVHMKHIGAPVLCDATYGKRTHFTEAEAAEAKAAIDRALASAARGGARKKTSPANRKRRPAPPGAATAALTADDAAASSPEKSGGIEGLLLARQGLHAWRLGFDHPMTGDRIRVVSPLPADMAQTLAALRRAWGRDGGLSDYADGGMAPTPSRT